jgi:hypothetical protein
MNRLCFVLDSYPPAIGGAENALQQIVEGLARHDFSIHVVTTRFTRDMPRVDDREGITIVRVRVPHFLYRWWFFIRALPCVIRQGRKSDIILGSTYGGVLPAFFGSVITRKKRVLLVHEVMGKRWFQFERNTLKALLYYLSETILVRIPFRHVVAVSEYTRHELVRMGIATEILSAIYHGAPEDFQFPKKNRDDVRTSMAG